MTYRDMLIKLITQKQNWGQTYEKSIYTRNVSNSELADHLLANGVIVPPFKVGTKVYVITSKTSNNKNLFMFEDYITHYHFDGIFTIMCLENHLGVPDYNWDKVFLTKEEAEEKLKELGK